MVAEVYHQAMHAPELLACVCALRVLCHLHCRHRPSQSWLAALAPLATQHLASASQQAVANTLWAMAVLRITPPADFMQQW